MLKAKKVFLNFQASDGFFLFLKRPFLEKYSHARLVMYFLVMTTQFPIIELHLETQGHGLLEKTLLLKAGLQIDFAAWLC